MTHFGYKYKYVIAVLHNENNCPDQMMNTITKCSYDNVNEHSPDFNHPHGYLTEKQFKEYSKPFPEKVSSKT